MKARSSISACLLHVLGHHGRVYRNGCVEIREDYNEESENQVIPESGIVTESIAGTIVVIANSARLVLWF